MKVSFTPTLSVLNQMQRTSKAISKSLERLSSGKRVNRAADDSVTLSRNSSMEAQVRGLRQGIQNANQAIGMLSTAESAISTQLEIVTKMRELALRASNGTLTSSDRTNINTEINQLFQEFQRITNTTEFNGQYLLNGSMGKVGLQIGDKRESGMDQIFMDISNLDASRVFQQTVGSGTFATRVTKVPETGTIAGIVKGDFNGDGKVDIATSNSTGSTMSILLGDGEGRFDKKTTFNVSGGGGPTQTADLNGDGILDLITLGGDTSTVNTFIGNGDGTFVAGATMAGVTAIQTGDYNGDGNIDIFAGNGDGVGVDVYLGNGSGSFGAAMSSGAVASGSLADFKVVDLNHDQYSDITVSDGDISASSAYRNNGNNTLTATWSSSLTFGTTEFGDFNNDGNVDMVFGGSVYIGNGKGGFTTGTSVGSSNRFLIGDLNGDGNLDLMSYDGRLLFGKGDGTFTFQKTVSLGSLTYGYDFADLNGDDVLDIIALDYSNLAANAVSTSLQTTQSDFRASRIDASTQAKAQSLLKILDNALTSLRSEQSRLGGLHERLDQAVSTNLLRADSIDEARENANSADLALETANLVRFQILQQAQVAVLAQANFSARLVADLLRPLLN